MRRYLPGTVGCCHLMRWSDTAQVMVKASMRRGSWRWMSAPIFVLGTGTGSSASRQRRAPHRVMAPSSMPQAESAAVIEPSVVAVPSETWMTAASTPTLPCHHLFHWPDALLGGREASKASCGAAETATPNACGYSCSSTCR
ncbi:hypothetical protein ABL78_5190 [Leptomonas seymouri]|uniref:Uncharacterized protein n=1 Tax=Leptomonas seymouri TaxID=5684 RepID=A0A0N1PBQ9_LEPSE|nr:hypothetical protein ABL78_5190 [Leptomonas seymouri]|eukprot:KPI85741.1 hypothetical protein ABL78_5190 [Leptomonas seymouri]